MSTTRRRRSSVVEAHEIYLKYHRHHEEEEEEDDGVDVEDQPTNTSAAEGEKAADGPRDLGGRDHKVKDLNIVLDMIRHYMI